MHNIPAPPTDEKKIKGIMALGIKLWRNSFSLEWEAQLGTCLYLQDAVFDANRKDMSHMLGVCSTCHTLMSIISLTDCQNECVSLYLPILINHSYITENM